MEETLYFAKQPAVVTRGHPENIKGAQAVAAVIFWARIGVGKAQIKGNITRRFDYDLSRGCNQIRPYYYFNKNCQETVPQAVTAFLESDSFEHVIRLAIPLGGDSDTLVAITGSIAEAYHDISVSMRRHALAILPHCIAETLLTFESQYQVV